MRGARGCCSRAFPLAPRTAVSLWWHASQHSCSRCVAESSLALAGTALPQQDAVLKLVEQLGKGGGRGRLQAAVRIIDRPWAVDAVGSPVPAMWHTPAAACACAPGGGERRLGSVDLTDRPCIPTCAFTSLFVRCCDAATSPQLQSALARTCTAGPRTHEPHAPEHRPQALPVQRCGRAPCAPTYKWGESVAGVAEGGVARDTAAASVPMRAAAWHTCRGVVAANARVTLEEPQPPGSRQGDARGKGW